VPECRGWFLVVLTSLVLLGLPKSSSAQSFEAGQSSATPVHPNAVAIGDFNEDGNADLAVPCWSPNSVSIFLGDGAGGISAPVNYATGPGPRFVVVADFNRDGHQDLAFANQATEGPGEVAVLIGTGTGTFEPARHYPAQLAPFHLAVADFDNDGLLDVVVANSGSGSISILIGDGAGGFGAAVSIPVGDTPKAVVAGDFNRDGNADVAVSNFGSGDVWLLHGDGSGSFGPPLVFPVGSGPFKLATADFNGDGRLDLAVPNFNGGTVSVLLGDPAAGLVPAGTIGVGLNPRAVTVGDFDRDGLADLAVANMSSNTVTILRGDGAGSFLASAIYGTGMGPFHVGIADLNRDGVLDLVSADRDGHTVTVVNGRTDGTFAAPRAAPAGAGQQSVAGADLNQDGMPDLVTASAGANVVSVLWGTGGGTTTAPVQYAVPGSPTAVVVGDFDSDGAPDIASANPGKNSVYLLRAIAPSGFLPPVKFSAGSGPRALVAADFNLDGALDLATANYNGNTAAVLLGNGAGGFAAPVTLQTGTGPSGIASADFDGDGRPDLATSNASSNSVSVLLANMGGGFSAARTFPAGTGAAAIAAGDFDMDGNPDLAVANELANSVTLLRNDGTGSFVALAPLPVGARPLGVVLADLTGDDAPEVIVAASIANVVHVFINDGHGNFAGRLDLPAGRRSRGLSVVDFDTDGQPDIAVANGDSHEAWILLNRSGSVADLSVAVGNASTSVMRGAAVSYVIEVSNAGPSTLSSLALTLALPSNLAGATISAAEGSFDPASGLWSGLDLAAGDQVFLTVSGTVGATASGDFAVVVSVSGPTGTADPVPADNTAADVDRVITGSADLSLTITDGQVSVAAGDLVSYTIVATNLGPTDVANARVRTSTSTDLATLTWRCTASGGATCASSGSGPIDDLVSLPVGGVVTYVLDGVLSPSAANGTMTGGASIEAPLDILETDAGNNTASDTDTVQGDNPPVANAQSVAVAEDGAISITLTANDPDADPLTFIIESQPAHGAISEFAGGTLTYTPNPNYFGSDSFTFWAGDGILSSTATVSITVTPVNDPPTALSLVATTPEDVALPLVLSAMDPDGDTLTYTVVIPPGRGSLTGTGASRTYTPNLNLSGQDTITFVVSDGTTQSAPATITIAVLPVNDPPVVANPISDVSINGEVTSTAVDVSSVFSDAENGTGLSLFVSSSDATLAAASLSGTTLVLDFPSNRSGIATITVRATDPQGLFVEDSFLVQITRPGARLSVSDASRGEGLPLTFTLTLSEAAASTVTVSYATAPGTAAAGVDFVATAGVVTFSPGVTTRTVTVATVQDPLDEDDETLSLVLSAPVGAILDDAQGIGAIVDNDTASLYVGNISVSEGSAGNSLATFTVTLSTPSSRDVSVDFATQVVSASAVAGTDFLMRSGSLLFAAGQNAPQTVAVEVIGDLTYELAEAFSLALSNASNAAISRPVARATIVDDDDPPQVSVDDVSLVEGQSGTKALVFTLRLSRASGVSATVTYQTSDGTATAGADYTAKSGQVYFAPGVTSLTVAISLTGDLAPEPSETFLLLLSSPVSLTILDGTGLGTIQDDDSGI
jgi:hypothetical protein